MRPKPCPARVPTSCGPRLAPTNMEGRAPSDVPAWLAATPRQWREQIRYVDIDMSADYRAAIRIGLPRATVVVDHFHVVQLANKMLSVVRRRTTAQLRGRRGRATDPEWKARRRLLRNREDLTDAQFSTMWNALTDAGAIGMTLLTAWVAKERLRDLLACARTGADRHRVGHQRWKFLTWCADSDIPEVRRLAATVDRWWPETAAFIATGHTQRQERRHQPRDQALRPGRPRLPQPCQSAPTDTMRHHPPRPGLPPHCLDSKSGHPDRPPHAASPDRTERRRPLQPVECGADSVDHVRERRFIQHELIRRPGALGVALRGE